MDLPLILNDLGGPVYERVEDIKEMEGVRIKGLCVSACTLYLGLPETCVYPSARLGFHGPRLSNGWPMLREEFDTLTTLMASHYPSPIKEWFITEARFNTGEPVYITGKQLIKYGVRSC